MEGYFMTARLIRVNDNFGFNLEDFVAVMDIRGKDPKGFITEITLRNCSSFRTSTPCHVVLDRIEKAYRYAKSN